MFFVVVRIELKDRTEVKNKCNIVVLQKYLEKFIFIPHLLKLLGD